MSTKIKFNVKAREALKRGVDTVANAVKVSLGAEGRNVIVPLQQGGYGVTKDGVTIAKAIFPEDEMEAIGASLIKEAAGRTNYEAGDGTTTSAVIAQSIFSGGLDLINKKASSVELKKGIDKATKDVVKYLKKVSNPVGKNNLVDVATVSANGDEELGEIISKAFNKIGKHGQVITAISDTAKTHVKLREGVVLDKGYTSRVFKTDPIKDTCELDDPYVLLHRGKIEKGDAIVKLFDNIFKADNDGRILIITDDIDPFVHSVIAQNIDNGAIRGRICVVTFPQILKVNLDLLNDLAILTGATIVSQEKGTKISPEVLGKISKCIVSEVDTVIVGDANNINEIVEEIKQKIDITENKFDKEELQERLARITGGIATLYVGSKSDSELKEKLDRVQDSINATRSALEEGIVAGGGVALSMAAFGLYKGEKNPGRFRRLFNKEKLSSFDQGYNLLLDACGAPSLQINENAGMPLSFVDGNKGIDVKTGLVVDMFEAGIIDPTKVTRCALENAASVTGTFLTTEVVIGRE